MSFRDALDAGYALLVEVLQAAHPLLKAIEEADRILGDSPPEGRAEEIDNAASLQKLRSLLQDVDKKGVLVG